MADDKEREIQLQFLDEAQDHLQTLESVFMGLSGARIDSAALNGALRAAHSMKGGGSLMGFPILSQLAHRLEDGMKVLKIQKESVNPDDRLEYLLLSAVDCLRSVIDCNLKDVAPDADWLAHTADPIFDELYDRLGDPTEEDAESVLSPEEGADILPILFETEVEGCLERIENVLATDDKPCLHEELLILAQELGGLGAMLQLDAFCHLCASIAYALQAAPTRTLEIAHIAVAEWRRSQSLVLTQQLDLLPRTIEVSGLDIRLAPDLDPTNFLAMMAVAQSGDNEHHLVSGPSLHTDTEFTQSEFRHTEFTPFDANEDIVELDSSVVVPMDLYGDDNVDSHGGGDNQDADNQDADNQDANNTADSGYQDLPDDIFSTAHGISFHIRNSENALAQEPVIDSTDDATSDKFTDILLDSEANGASNIQDFEISELDRNQSMSEELADDAADDAADDGLRFVDLDIIDLEANIPDTDNGSQRLDELDDVGLIDGAANIVERNPIDSTLTNLEDLDVPDNRDLVSELFPDSASVEPTASDQEVEPLESISTGNLENVVIHEWGNFETSFSDPKAQKQDSEALKSELLDPDYSRVESLAPSGQNQDLDQAQTQVSNQNTDDRSHPELDQESAAVAEPDIFSELDALLAEDSDLLDILSLRPTSRAKPSDSDDKHGNDLESAELAVEPDTLDTPEQEEYQNDQSLIQDTNPGDLTPLDSQDIWDVEDPPQPFNETCVEISQEEQTAAKAELGIGTTERDGLERDGLERNRNEISSATIDAEQNDAEQNQHDDESDGGWTLDSLLNDFATGANDSNVQNDSAQEFSEIENVAQWIDDQLDVLVVSDEDPLDLDELLAMPNLLGEQEPERPLAVVESDDLDADDLDAGDLDANDWEASDLDADDLEDDYVADDLLDIDELLADDQRPEQTFTIDNDEHLGVNLSPERPTPDPTPELTTLSPSPTTYLDEKDAIATWDTTSVAVETDPAEAKITETNAEDSLSQVSSQVNSAELGVSFGGASNDAHDASKLDNFKLDRSPVEPSFDGSSSPALFAEPSVIQASDTEASFPGTQEPSAIVDSSTSALEKAQSEEEATEFQLLNPTSSGVLPTEENENTFVRVGSKHLNQLNDLFGELTIDRNGLTIHLKRLRTLVKTLNRRVKLLDQANSHLRSLYDQGATGMVADKIQGTPAPYGHTPLEMELLPESLGNGSLEELELGLESQFDALEMDNYSDLHHLFQAVMEGMVQIQEVAEDLDLNLDDSEQSARNLNKTARQLQIELMHVRMRPLSDIASRFPRALRELSLKHGKPVEFKLSGGSTLIDRTILDSLGEPLMHLVRNAFDHGIEDKATRKAYGKPAMATIEIRASHKGNRTIITISDDGQGIALDKIRDRARQMGLDEMLLAAASEQELLSLIFEPGFSTATKTTDLSGRGVGMDVVRDRLQHVHGDIKISTRMGKGTTFTLSVPMTLSVTRVLLAESNGMLIAIPTDTVDEMIVLEPEQIMTTVGREVFEFDGKMAELIRLHEWLRFYCPRTVVDPLETAPSIKVPSVLIVRRGNQITGIEVERTWSEQEVTVRRAAGVPPLPDGFSSCTILGDGRVVPLVNIPALLHWIISSQRTPTGPTLTTTLIDHPSPEVFSTPDFSPHGPTPSYSQLPASNRSGPDVTPITLSASDPETHPQASPNDPNHPSSKTHPQTFGASISQGFPQSATGLRGTGLRGTGSRVASNSEASHTLMPSVALSSMSSAPNAMYPSASNPVATPEAAHFARPPQPTTPDPSTYYLLNQRPQILIVDDSIAVRRLLALTLEKASYRVEQAKDGQDALEKLNTGLHVDAMICDIEMPRLDGYRLLAKMKANARLRHVPVMVLTSRSGEKHRKLAMSLGAIAYFTKPYNEQLLVQRLSDVAQIPV